MEVKFLDQNTPLSLLMEILKHERRLIGTDVDYYQDMQPTSIIILFLSLQ